MADNKPTAGQSITLSHHLSKATKSTLLAFEDIVENMVVVPPDGGWGWVIVSMAFICYFLIDGIMYTFGLFLDEVSVTFKVTPTKVAMAGSLMSGFYFIVGPLTCAVTNRYGFRVVGILGGLLSSLTILLSTIFLNLHAFLILMGVICGIGFNMIFMPCLLIVGFYFEKWRALATAISLCGTSIGVISFPPIMTSLMRNLHWTWKFRVLSGLTLLTSFCAFTFRPIAPVKVTEDKPISLKSDGPSAYSVNVERMKQAKRSPFKTIHNSMYPTASEYYDTSSIYITSKKMNEDASDPSITKSMFIYKTDNQSVSLSTVYEMESQPKFRTRKFKNCLRRIFCCRNLCSRKEKKTPSSPTANINRPMYRDDIFYHGSVYLLPEYSKGNVAGPSSKVKASLSYHLSVTRVTTQRDVEESNRCVCCPEAVVRTIGTMLHCKLFQSPTFVMLLVSGFFSMLAMYCPFIFIVQRATEMGIHGDWAKLLLTVIGIANTVGRILCGVLSWFPKMDLIVISYSTLIIAGVSIIVSSYTNTLLGQIVFASIFGFNIASLTVLRSLVVVDLLGLENLTNAFGITSMFFGLGCFIGVPLAGILHDVTNSYTASFTFAGCSMILSGILMIPLRRISRWEKTKK